MGTSRRWPGPSGSAWTAAHTRLNKTIRQVEHSNGAGGPEATQPDPDDTEPSDASPLPVTSYFISDDKAETLARDYRDALAKELQAGSDRYGLRDAVEQSGQNLVDTLDALQAQSLDSLGPLRGATAEERRDEFTTLFTDRIASSEGLIVDAAIRRTATQAASEILRRSPAVQRAVETGEQAVYLEEGIFCEIYRIFFAGAVANFLKSVIAAKVKILAPILHFVDPADVIAKWIANQVVAIIPTPCEVPRESGESLADVGRGLIKETAERALGVSAEEHDG